jgi:RNA polymerase sigma-70 factor (ECF subfamily)
VIILIDIEAVYKEYFHDVYLYLLKLTSDKTLAEELTADTFLKVIKYKNNFKGNSQIKTWIISIAKNNFLNHIKKNKNIDLYENLDDLKTEENFERLLIVKEEVALIYKILEELKEPYQEVFKLRVIDELSFKEIGIKFKKSANWACVTYYRSREKIKKEVTIKNG